MTSIAVIRPWTDCPTCKGSGMVSEELDYYGAQFNDWRPFPAFEGDKSAPVPCPTCALHFSAVDIAANHGPSLMPVASEDDVERLRAWMYRVGRLDDIPEGWLTTLSRELLVRWPWMRAPE